MSATSLPLWGSGSCLRRPRVHAPDEEEAPARRFGLPTPTQALVIGSAACLGGGWMWWRFFRRLPTAAYITPKLLRRSKHISGTVVRVGDGDGFRMYHQPGGRLFGPWLYPLPERRLRLGEETISIRLAGADAPELAHFGNPAQPYAKEALEELTHLVKGRYITVGLGHLDQYNRLVGTPYVWRPPYVLGPTNVSLFLVKSGLATVYTQSGAEYGKSSYLDVMLGRTSSGQVRLIRAQELAKKWRRGMWSLKHMTTPAEYKKAVKGEGST